MCPNKWKDVKMKKEERMSSALCLTSLLVTLLENKFLLRESKIKVVAPRICDRFIGAWGIFPHHD